MDVQLRRLLTVLLVIAAITPAFAGFPSKGSHKTVAAVGLLCDLGVGTFKVFYGVRMCSAAYGANNAMAIKRTSDNATCTLKYLSNGLLDVSTGTPCSGSTTATAFCNATTCNITQINDTSGNLACSGSTTCAYSPSVTTGAMSLAFNCTGSIPCIHLTASTGTTNNTWSATSSQPYTVTAVADRISGTTGSTIFENSTGTVFYSTGPANTWAIQAGSASQTISPTDGTINAATAVFNGASSTWKLNSAAPATTAATPGANATGTTIRPLNGGASVVMNVFEMGFMNGAMSSGNQATVYSNQSAFYGKVF